MSTLAYAAMTSRREEATPRSSTSQSPPGVSTYVDALAALVPSEVLTLHALILSVTTKTAPATGNAPATTSISSPGTLAAAFYGLIALSALLYVGARLLAQKWDRLDYVRTIIPPLALVGWTMMQRATAFDAVFPHLEDAPRTVIGLFLAVILGIAAAALAYKADQKNPNNS